MNHSSEMVKAAYAALSDKKGEDIRIIDIRNVSVMADYFIIASGSNSNQVQAMVDNVEEELGRLITFHLPSGGRLSVCQLDPYGLRRHHRTRL